MKQSGLKKCKIRFANVALCCSLAITGITLLEVDHMNRKKIGQTFRLKRELQYIEENLIEVVSGTEFSVCTINVQNKYTSENGGFQSGSNLVLSLVEDEVDILGTQELKCSTAKSLDDSLQDYNYDLTGESRWGDGIVGFCFSFANETNSIIGSRLYMSKTDALPWIPQNIDELAQGIEKGSIMARVVTTSVIAVEGIGYVRCYNTHLDYGVPSIQRRQMDMLLEVIDNDYNELALPIIITGDFNAEPESENMKYFMNQLSQRGIQTAIENVNTYKGKMKDGDYIESPKQLDYIFYSEDFNMIDYQIIDNPSSDHDAILVKLSNSFNK